MQIMDIFGKRFNRLTRSGFWWKWYKISEFSCFNPYGGLKRTKTCSTVGRAIIRELGVGRTESS